MNKMMTFTREQLYKEIWELNAKKVSEKYDLNYPKLLKKCKEYKIPIPTSKYWIYLERGKDVSDLIIQLPSFETEEIFLDKNIDKHIETESIEIQDIEFPIEKEEDKQILNTQQIEKELIFLGKDKINVIIDSLSKFKINDNKRLNVKVSNYKKDVILWNQKQKNSERNYYDSRYERNTMEQHKFIKEVSVEQLPRLYKLLDILVEVFEDIGETIMDDLSIKIYDDIVSFEIIESTDKVEHELTKEEAKKLVEYNDDKKKGGYAWKPNIRKYDHIHNGRFRIKTTNGKYIKDSNTKKLEEVIPDIIILIYKSYLDIKTKREEIEERNRKWEEERRQKELLKERIQAEKDKTRSLLNILDDYQIAQNIRVYVEVLSQLENNVDNELIDWMLKKADWIDPTISLEDELLGKREHEKDKEDKYKFLKGERGYW
ncbi:MAG: cellulose synthase [Tissierellia bacterium]|nr:cellulose synthase [Tissierellia bacterium]